MPPVPRRKNSAATNNRPPPGFLPNRKAPHDPIKTMSERELHDLRRRNAHILANEPGTSTSPYMRRIISEQEQIENRLSEFEANQLDADLRNNLKIDPQSPNHDTSQPSGYSPPHSPTSNMIEAKRRALANPVPNARGTIGSMDMSEAMEIERRVQLLDRERKARIEEKRLRYGYSSRYDSDLRREDREAQIWEFMNMKPSDSDLEADSEEDPDEEDPATWFEDDQDDGIKGQDIVQPDDVDYSDIIRVDENHVHSYNTFYEPQDVD